jgi:hypothetical protein
MKTPTMSTVGVMSYNGIDLSTIGISTISGTSTEDDDTIKVNTFDVADIGIAINNSVVRGVIGCSVNGYGILSFTDRTKLTFSDVGIKPSKFLGLTEDEVIDMLFKARQV